MTGELYRWLVKEDREFIDYLYSLFLLDQLRKRVYEQDVVLVDKINRPYPKES